MRFSLLDRWARSSQQQARRNAMIASTRLTQLRIEREEVDRYLASRSEASTSATRAREADSGTTRTVRVVASR